MLFLYLIAVLFSGVGAIFWIFKHKIIWWEWLAGSVLAFVLAGAFHLTAVNVDVWDNETWSGQVTKTIYYPKWVEKYKEAVYKNKTVTKYRTNSDGKRVSYTTTERVFSHYETKYRTHSPYWKIETNIGETVIVSQSKYQEIGNVFGNNQQKKQVHKSGFYSGDKNIYWYSYTRNSSIVPFSTTKRWKNRLKNSTNVYSFAEVSEDQAKVLYDWPETTKWDTENRVLGLTDITPRKWSEMNAILGPQKQCNVIIVSFPSNKYDTSIAEYQRAYWKGGKKNDIVLVAGVDKNKNVEWSNSFGWAQDELIWANLDSILLNNQLNNDIIPLIQEEIRKSYQRKEWKDFNHIQTPVPFWIFPVYILVLLLAQFGFYWWAHNNEF